MTIDRKKVLIVGAGLGGLATALRLARRGFDVEIVEKYRQAGGRLNQLKKDGFTYDIGPTFFSMSYEFEEFRQFCDIEQPFQFVELDPLYTVNFNNDDANYHRRYVIYKDLKRLAAEFQDIETDFEAKMRQYLSETAAIFHDTEYLIVKHNFDTIVDFAKQMTKVPLRHAPKLVRTMWQELSRYFSSYEVKVIFSLVAFFLGNTPFQTPAVYSLLTYTELQHDGYYNVKGGMYKIVEGIVNELEKENVKIHYHTFITDFVKLGDNLTAFIDQNGQRWAADVFVVNSDAAAFRGEVFRRKAFSEKRLDKMEWTLAPFTMYLGVKGKVENLDHHNYFLRDNFKNYAARIFKNSVNPQNPYYYVNALSKFNPESAPPDCENIFILCPVPDLRNKPQWNDRDQLAQQIMDDLAARTGFDIKRHLISQTILDPNDWRNMFHLYKGSGLGLAHGISQIGGFRPKNYDEKFGNVFYTGASTVPGTGLPMMMISSRLVAERILQKFRK